MAALKKGDSSVTSLREEVKEIVEIVALVPDEHKAMCFEMLLKEVLAKQHLPPKATFLLPLLGRLLKVNYPQNWRPLTTRQA